MVTPTGKVELKEADEVLNSPMATLYRAITARRLYLSQDRSDMKYAIREAPRSVSSPRKSDW